LVILITSSNWPISTKTIAGSLIGGLKPKLHDLDVGPLPAGAFMRVTGSIPGCPLASTGRRFYFQLYALSTTEHINLQHADAAKLRNRLSNALAIGLLVAAYGRVNKA
jgi:hypothetical protein